ncbi:MAG: AraC family transcriptional regulator [Pseudomonadota bacterium]|nr:AraC family transcriptional regulator [Pseudomonadota bacterium]
MSKSPPQRAESLRGSAQTPMAWVHAILTGYRRHGADPAKALAAAGISAAQLADPAARITAAQMEALTLVAMQELDDEAPGWFSRPLPWGSYGMLCRASITAPDLGVALKRWCRHHRLLTTDVLLELSIDADQARLRLVEQRDLGALREFCLLSLLRYLLGYACWAVDSRLPLRGASFPGPVPAHAGVYALLFAGPVDFGGQHAEIRFDARYLRLALRRDETALRAMLQRALPLTVLQYRRDRLLFERVRQLLRSATGMGASAERLATLLSVSLRTFHRHLREEGTSLQALKDEARRDRAQTLLARGDRPVKQVAAAAGFRNEKAFARAFRSWTGETPSAFRRRSRVPSG